MRNKGLFLLLASAAMVLHVQPASAGFEWHAPASAAPPAAEAPAETSGEPAAPMPVPLAPVSAETVQSMVSAPVAASDFEGVESFGKDMGIAVALRQIIPADYQFTLAPEVDPGQKLSWQGQGQPWPDFLNETLAPHGLKAYVRDHIVVVASADALQSLPPATAKAVPPMQTITSAPPAPAMPAMPSADESKAQITWDETRDAPLPIYKTQQEPAATPSAMTSATPPAMPPVEPRAVAAEKETIVWQEVAPAAPTPPAPVAAMTPPPLEEKTVMAPVMPPEEPAYNPAPVAAAVEAPPMVSQRVEIAPPAGKQVEIMPETPTWIAPQGASLRDVLKNWTAQAGVRLFWSIDYDYRLSRDIKLSGNFETAVQAILDNFAGTYPRPTGKLYTGSSERVLVINSPDLLS